MYEMPKAYIPMLLLGATATVAIGPGPCGPKWTPLNINDRVRVKLSEHGLAELRRQDDELCVGMPAAFVTKWRERDAERYKPDAQGFVQFQIWDLMRRLGHMMDVGLEPPFEPAVLMESHS